MAPTATNATLIGIPLAVDGGNDDGSVMSETSERASSEHASSYRDDSSSRCSGPQDIEKLRQMKIAQTEERHVTFIRVVTFSFIIFAAIAVCAMVYIFAKDYDKHDFELEVSA